MENLGITGTTGTSINWPNPQWTINPYWYLYPYQYQPVYQVGWQCPKCLVVYAPWWWSCACETMKPKEGK